MAESKLCAGCLRDDEKVSATSWCSDCGELVCKTCTKYHKRFSPPHRIIPADGSTDLNSSLLRMSRYCEVHPDEKILMFCCQHDCVVCAACVTKSHHKCESVLSIEIAAKGARDLSALSDLVSRLESLLVVTTTIRDTYMKNESSFYTQKEQFEQQILEIRSSLNTQLDDMESEINKDLKNIYDEGKEKIKSNIAMVNKVHQQVSVWKNDLKSLSEHASDIHMFQAIKAVDAKVHMQEEVIKEIHDKTRKVDILFEPSKIVKEALSLGKLSLVEKRIETPTTNEKGQQSQTITHGFCRVRVSPGLVFSVVLCVLCLAFVSFCWPWSCLSSDLTVSVCPLGIFQFLIHVPISYTNNKPKLVMSFKTSQLRKAAKVRNGRFIDKNRLVFVAFQENRLFICNKDGSQSKQIELLHLPIDVTVTDHNQAIVTLRFDGIQFIDLKEMRSGKTMKLSKNGYHWGIASNKNTTCVDVDNDLFVIDNSGKVLKQIKDIGYMNRICIGTNEYIYAPSINGITVIKPNTESHDNYQHHNLKSYVGIAVDNKDTIYVACDQTNTIHKIVNNGRDGHIILTKEDGVDRPSGLDYNTETNELLVINEGYSAVNIYKL